MKLMKYGTGILCGLLLCFGAFAQETSVENEYLQSVEDQIITELATQDDRDDKLVAIQYLEEAVNAGKVTPEMMKALDRLAGEGITTQTRTKGRITNNYPDIRAKACDILAKVPTEESKETLKIIALNDNEPMVLTAAIRALGEIGINNGDEIVNAITWSQNKVGVLNPTSSMALEVLVAYEKLAPTVQDKGPMLEQIAKIANRNSPYVTPVRNKAKELLKKLQEEGK